jgi:hypothetical protein
LAAGILPQGRVTGAPLTASKWQSETKQKLFTMGLEMIAVFIPIVAIIGAIIMVVYLRRFENEERMAMIEKGVDPSVFTKKVRNTSGALRASLLFVGAGIGLLIAYFLDRAFAMEEVAYFSMVFLFGGAGLGISYMIEEKKNKNS